jgi:hypothetical protein
LLLATGLLLLVSLAFYSTSLFFQQSFHIINEIASCIAMTIIILFLVS